jgi:CheY-like chemotaxis protein
MAPDLTLAPGTYAQLTVRDNGHGIPQEIIERIFDPYFTTKEKHKGTGLGLAVVHGIVQKHGGAVTVRSTPGEGSLFTVYFPSIDGDCQVPPPTVPVAPKGSECILMVDDEPTLVETGAEILRQLGYQVVAKTGSTEALDAFRARSEAFDLVITDMTMPGMAGNELAREILRLRPELPVILVTGYSELVSRESALQDGIRELVMKPFRMAQLAQTIRKVLRTQKHRADS